MTCIILEQFPSIVWSQPIPGRLTCGLDIDVLVDVDVLVELLREDLSDSNASD